MKNIIRASFSQERMQYLADEGTVIYSAKDGKDKQDLSRLGMVGRHVFPHPEQGGADGAVLWVCNAVRDYSSVILTSSSK